MLSSVDPQPPTRMPLQTLRPSLDLILVSFGFMLNIKHRILYRHSSICCVLTKKLSFVSYEMPIFLVHKFHFQIELAHKTVANIWVYTAVCHVETEIMKQSLCDASISQLSPSVCEHFTKTPTASLPLHITISLCNR